MDEYALAAGAANGEMYTDEMILKREQLRSDPRVVEALDGAWERMRAARGGSEGTSIAREPYMAMSRKLYLFFKCQQMEAYLEPEDCFAECQRDWTSDSKGKEALSKEDFAQSFFQLADIHTDGVDGTSYAALIAR